MDSSIYFLLRHIIENQHINYSDIPTTKQVLKKAQQIFSNEPPILDLQGHFIIVGDIHGDLDTLLRIFENSEYPDKKNFIFLGDYIDRGHSSLEVILLLFSLKVLFPLSIYLIRGNHEDPIDFSIENKIDSFCFSHELKEKKVEELASPISECFVKLPIACILNNYIFLVHGGISPSIKSREDIFKLSKPPSCIPDEGTEVDLLWSDPLQISSEFSKNTNRSVSYYYGQKAVDAFLENCFFSYIIRGHEFCQKGYSKPLQNVVTVFSTCDYLCSGNDAAILNQEGMTGHLISIPFIGKTKLRRRIIPEFVIKETLDDFEFNEDNYSEPPSLIDSIKTSFMNIFN